MTLPPAEPTLRLYHNKSSRSTRPRWLIEEGNLPVEIRVVDMQGGEHKTEEYRQIHPHGKVPALVDGDMAIMESAAICLYLADRFPEAGLAPAIDAPERAEYYQWIVYAMVTLEPPIQRFSLLHRAARADAPGKAAAQLEFDACARVLTSALNDRTWLLGEEFCAADIVVGSCLAWAAGLKMVEAWPVLQSYVSQCKERPAFARARA